MVTGAHPARSRLERLDGRRLGAHRRVRRPAAPHPHPGPRRPADERGRCGGRCAGRAGARLDRLLGPVAHRARARSRPCSPALAVRIVGLRRPGSARLSCSAMSRPLLHRHRRGRPRAVLPVADRHAARRAHAHRPVQLGLRAPHRRHDDLPHRGHRRRARQRGELPAAAGCAALAPPGLGRGRRDRRPARAVPAVAAHSTSTATCSSGSWTPATSTRASSPPRRWRPATTRTAATRSRATTTSSATSPPEQIAAFRAEGREPALRLRVPDGDLGFDDLVRGEITFPAGTATDFVVVRPNGVPLYTFVNPVDDALMGVTHVLRGEDLLPSTARQIALYHALIDIGVTDFIPRFGHLPLGAGRGQQEAVEARPRVEPVPPPRPRLHPRGAGQLPLAARLGDRARPRRVLDG